MRVENMDDSEIEIAFNQAVSGELERIEVSIEEYYDTLKEYESFGNDKSYISR